MNRKLNLLVRAVQVCGSTDPTPVLCIFFHCNITWIVLLLVLFLLRSLGLDLITTVVWVLFRFGVVLVSLASAQGQSQPREACAISHGFPGHHSYSMLVAICMYLIYSTGTAIIYSQMLTIANKMLDSLIVITCEKRINNA